MAAFLFIVVMAGLLSGCNTQTPTPLPDRLEAIPPEVIKMTPELDAHAPILHADGWEPPVPLAGPVNTAGGEDSPFILPDGSTLYFFFTPDVRLPAEKQLLDGVTGIYVAQKQNDVWATPQRVVLQDPGKLALDGCAFVQGDVLWFCSAREGYAGIGIFTARFQDGRWDDWQFAGETYQVGELHFSADGQELYFHADRPGGLGGFDLWVMEREAESWQPAVNLQSLNTSETEGWPFLSQDGRQLWFTRTYQGTPAVFRSHRIEGGWGEAELIVSQFAGEPTLDEAGNLYFVHHFFKDGQMLEADIYVAYRK